MKLAILCAYELVPKAYRQKFRGHKNKFLPEICREKSMLFDKWCSATKTEEFDSLRQLILLEEFKGCLSERVVVYLSEQMVNSLSQATVAPLPKTKAGNQYLFTIMCRATRFAEAVPLRNIKVHVVLKIFIKFFSIFELQSYSNQLRLDFLSWVFNQTLKSLSIAHRVSSVYHLEKVKVQSRGFTKP